MTFTVSRELAIPRPLDQPVIVQLVVHKNKPIVWLFTLRTNDHALNRRMMVIAVTILCSSLRIRTSTVPRNQTEHLARSGGPSGHMKN